MRLRWWLTNRVLIGMALFFVVIGLWEFRWKPQYRPHYEQGVAYYTKGQYLEALNEFTIAYNIDRNRLDVILMMGWSNLKLKHMEEARFYFDRAIAIDPRTDEAQMGTAFVALETGRGRLDAKMMQKIMGKRGGDPNARILAAGAMVQEGNNFDAAAIYRDLVEDRNYGHAASVALEELYGLKGFSAERVPSEMPDLKKPQQTQVTFRAAEGAMLRLGKAGWEKMYANGINLGPAAPGYYPAVMPNDGQMYTSWLQQAAQLNANVVRTYTLLPPSFYRAFAHANEQGRDLVLYQQIWVPEPPEKDMYDEKYMDEVREEIRFVVDAIHGRGNVRPKRARGSGLYMSNVSSHVGAILLGSEMGGDIVGHSNVINAGKTRFDGKYIAISNADSVEVWYAQMLDYLITYETDTYNMQHPVAIVDPPTSDIARPTESKITVKPAFYAGLFAAYSAFPYYPEALIKQPQYQKARDSEGPNSVYGYLRELRSKMPYPLVVAAVGVPNSIGIGAFQAATGWNQGGHSEDQQAQIITRLVRSTREAGCAGALVFELMDEWYKDAWVHQGFKYSAERSPLWMNDMDPSERYGLIGYRTKQWALFAGNEAAWNLQQKLYSSATLLPVNDGYDADRTIKSVHGATDEGYLYLKIALQCVDCTPGKPDNKPHWDKAAFAVAINTLPGKAGIRKLPFGGVKIASGANFLLYLGDPAQSRLYVAESYNPFVMGQRADRSGESQVLYRNNFAASLKDSGSFVEIAVHPNTRQVDQGAGLSPNRDYSFGAFRYGNGNPSAPDYNSQAEWYVDAKQKAILVRIPWGQLLMADPSGFQALSGYRDPNGVLVATSAEVEVSVFALKPGEPAGDLTRATVVASLPSSDGGPIRSPQKITWKRWDTVSPEPYQKKAFFAVRDLFQKTAGTTGTLKPAQPSAVPAGME